MLLEELVLVGPEAGMSLTRDAIKTQFEFQSRKVDTARWLQRTKQDKGPASLSIMQSRNNLLRALIHCCWILRHLEDNQIN